MMGSVGEFEAYKYTRTKDGKPNKKEPQKMYDHGMDVDRYVISSSIPYFKEQFMPLYEEIEGEFWG